MKYFYVNIIFYLLLSFSIGIFSLLQKPKYGQLLTWLMTQIFSITSNHGAGGLHSGIRRSNVIITSTLGIKLVYN